MQPVALNNTEVWAYVVETDEGLRVRFDVDDWQRFGLGQGSAFPCVWRERPLCGCS